MGAKVAMAKYGVTLQTQYMQTKIVELRYRG